MMYIFVSLYMMCMYIKFMVSPHIKKLRFFKRFFLRSLLRKGRVFCVSDVFL